MAILDDMSVFFSTAEFAVTATFTPVGGAPVSAAVLFDRQTQDLWGDDAISDEMVITFPASELAGIKAGDTGTISGDRYKIRYMRLVDDGKLKKAVLTRL